MATYKVIQDIEAEDKLLGPLTLKQFIFAIIVIVCGFIAFKLATIQWFLALPFLPPMIVFGVLAAPLGRDQPTEIWLLAKIRYFLKPKVRIWDQTGQLDFVTITAPKKIDPIGSSDNLSQTEVKSRLKALGDTIDSRGWAVKNVPNNMYGQVASGDRLLSIDMSAPPSTSLVSDVKDDEDMLDAANNPVAQQLDHMISASTTTHRQQTLKKMQQIRERLAQVKEVKTQPKETANTWFMGQKQSSGNPQPSFVPSFSASTPTATVVSEEEQEILATANDNLAKQKSAYANMKTLRPTTEIQNASAPVTPAPDPAILGLASNDDLTVSTIARQAKQNSLPEDEVTVSLR